MGHDDRDEHRRWQRFKSALAHEPMPCAMVDLDAFDANVRALARVIEPCGKALRVATKSLRCPDLVARVRDGIGASMRGLMTYTAAETAFWARRGERDLLLAYPTVLPSDTALIAQLNTDSTKTAAALADCVEHLDALASAAREEHVQIPVVLDVDIAWRPLGQAVHIGVRRSPLRDAVDVVALARRVSSTRGLRFHGVMTYEAQIAGVPDTGPATRVMKAACGRDVTRRRAALARALEEARFTPTVFNGGGTGSMATSTQDAALNEVTAGSWFLGGHSFDACRGLEMRPAAWFALQVVRRPGKRLVTCHGGGYVASGSAGLAGSHRLPAPALPGGLRLLSLEGAGEVQTPLEVPAGLELALGDPVFFRHAKAGELAEHFAEYLLVRDDRVVGRVPTYRGLGMCFLG